MLSPEQRAAANKGKPKQRIEDPKAKKKLTPEEEAALIEKQESEIYEKCEKALEERWTGQKGCTVWVSCKYKKRAAIDNVCAFYKQNKWTCKVKYDDPGDDEGGRLFLVFGE